MIEDTDDDGDGWTDTLENTCSTDPLVSTSVPQDLDNDGTCEVVVDGGFGEWRWTSRAGWGVEVPIVYKFDGITSVSYTHLTLPTIYSV